MLDIIREIRERKGVGEPFYLRRLHEKVEIIGAAVDLERLNTSISIAITDRIGVTWDEWCGRLTAYKRREGDCLVAQDYCDPVTGYRLGFWVSNQRRAQETMSPTRRARLNALGFVWDHIGGCVGGGLPLLGTLLPAGRTLSHAYRPSRARLSVRTMGPNATPISRHHATRPSSSARRPGVRLEYARGSVGRRLLPSRTLLPAGRTLPRARWLSRPRHRLSARFLDQ